MSRATRVLRLCAGLTIVAAVAAPATLGEAVGDGLSASAVATSPRPPRERLQVQRPAFSIASVTPAGPVQAGQTGSAAVTVSRVGGHTATITLGVAGNPQSITGSGTVAAGATSGTLALTVPAATAAGTYSLTVTGSDGTKTASRAFDLTVTAPAGSATLSASRAYHSETRLPNGKVLLAGGRNASYLPGADLYDPATGLVYPTGAMATARVSHTATLLKNGTVLIAGGFTTSETATANAETYDPATGTFTPTGSLTRPRGLHTATLLPSGEVLMVGGYTRVSGVSTYPTTAEIYNPTTGSFRDGGSLSSARGAHRATEVFAAGDDRILISGGYGAAGFVKSLEWYSVATGSFTTASASLADNRGLHTAILLPNNTILLAGGEVTSSLPPSATATAELYNLATNTIAPTGSLVAARGAHTSTLVGGKVIVCGGVNFLTVHTSVESYDPASGVFTTLATPMATARALQSATLLASGKILLAGGGYVSGFSIAYLNTLELYTPPSP